MTDTAYQTLVERLDKVRAAGSGATACCPAHDDRNPSLSIAERDDGTGIVVHCHAGCTPEAIVKAVGLELGDLFNEPRRNGTDTTHELRRLLHKQTPPPTQPRRKIAEYPYIDEHGELLYRVIRYEPKTFRQQAADGTWSTKNIRKVLYRLPEIIAAPGEPVIICEGEKDVDRARQLGWLATCSPGGAGKWSAVTDSLHHLQNRTIIIVADNDEPGEHHADTIRTSLADVADVTVMKAATGNDLADHLDAGHTLADLTDWTPNHTSTDPTRFGNDWWQQTPQLAHIAQAADARIISREAVLLAALVNITLHIPPIAHLPGPPRKGTPNLIAITPAPPGEGKGSAADCANDILPPPNNTKHLPLGTAEGFVKTFFQPNPDKEDRKTRPLIQHGHPVLIRTDEVGVFVQQMGRQSASGEGLLAQLKQMCSGERLGFGYATAEKRLVVPPWTYRAGMYCGVVPLRAAALFDDQGGGLPERMIFGLATAEHLPDDDELDNLPDDPGPLNWQSPWTSAIRSNTFRATDGIPIDNDVADRMQRERMTQRRAIRDGQTDDGLDAHRIYNRLRVAAAIANLHGDIRITMRWIDLAEQIMTVSDATRRWLLQQVRQQREATADATDETYARRAVRQQQALRTDNEAHHTQKMVRCAHRIAAVVADGENTVAKARRRITIGQRDVFDDALHHALENGWIVEAETAGQGDTKRTLTPGPTTP